MNSTDLNCLKWLNVDEAAAFLRVTPKAIRNMVFRRAIRFSKFGRRLRFKRADLDRLLESSMKGELNGNQYQTLSQWGQNILSSRR
jgi:excisionase family DNA binding protein